MPFRGSHGFLGLAVRPINYGAIRKQWWNEQNRAAGERSGMVEKNRNDASVNPAVSAGLFRFKASLPEYCRFLPGFFLVFELIFATMAVQGDIL